MMKHLLSAKASLLAFGALSALSALTACSDEGETAAPDTPAATASGRYFLAVKTDDGSEYVMQTTRLDSADLNVRDNILELPQTEYTWVFDGPTAVGMVYKQQFAGIGYALRLDAPGSPLRKLGEFAITTRFSTYGFFDGQLVTSVAGQLSTDGTRNDGATFAFWNIGGEKVTLDRTQTLWTEDLTGNGEQVTFSGIVDEGDGTFLTAMVQSSFHQTGTGDGSSVGDVRYPDSVWVARMDKNLNVLHVFRDDRISYAAGRYRSQVLNEVFRADDGTAYVFSNAFDSGTSHPAGALRILPGADAFAPDYYFNIQEAADGYKFRRVWHLAADKFLLEIYNEKQINTMTPGHQFAIVSMETKTFRWLTGLPSKGSIYSGVETGGVPLYHDGVVYLPITVLGSDAMIYNVNPETGEAVRGISIKGATEIRTIGYLE